MTILVTGGAGFIGSAVVACLSAHARGEVVNVDKLTYAGSVDSLEGVASSAGYSFECVDICDPLRLDLVFERYRPAAVIHLAAETHVDRSIDNPDEFLRTNLFGTANLLQASLRFYRGLPRQDARSFRFVHVSTNEVYGDLESGGAAFTEQSRYAPSSPYSATKAGSDHLVRAWYRTYGLPVIVTNSSNNFGPRQYPEKLIPHTILSLLANRPVPVYGDGTQVRDWIYVEDHARALFTVLREGAVGETYNIGAHSTQRNIDVVRAICAMLENSAPRTHGREPYESLITLVADRPGHDVNYAIDASKIMRDLAWRPRESFASGLEKTVRWYLQNRSWWQRILDGNYQLERLGTGRD